MNNAVIGVWMCASLFFEGPIISCECISKYWDFRTLKGMFSSISMQDQSAEAGMIML